MDTNLLKFGDGVSDWNTLQYFGPATTEYTEGDVDATISGPAILWEDAADTLRTVSAATPLPVNVIGGTITAGTIEITNDAGNPIPVSATDLDIRNLVFATDKVDISGSTLAANSGVDIGDVTINNAAGASAVNIQDGGNSVTVDAPVGTPVNVQIGDGTLTATVRNTGAADSLNVAITDASGNQITTFGGASEYTEGATDASITGTAILMEGAGDTLLPVQGTVADGLLVNLGANNDVVVSATNLDIRDLTNTDVVTAELSAVDNAVLDAIAASVSAIDTDTTTIIGHLDGVEALLTTIDADTSNLALETTATSIKTAVEIIDNAILGTEMQVDIVAALPAGTNNIGDVDILSIAAGDNNIGNVDIASIAAGTNYVGKVRLTDGTLDSNLVDETGASAVDALAIGGGTPHDSVDSGNPVKVGFKAASALPSAVASADRANGISDLFGRQLVAHIDPAMQIWKSFNSTSSVAAGAAEIIWTPAAGKKIAITSVIISTYGTTSARMFLFFAANADLTYTAGTDQPVFVGSFSPSATTKPGMVFCPPVPIIANTADYKLLYQNDAALSVDITLVGYEV